MKRIFLLLILNLLIAGYGRAQKSRLQRQGNATQLIINDTPYLFLAENWEIHRQQARKTLNAFFPNCRKWD